LNFADDLGTVRERGRAMQAAVPMGLEAMATVRVGSLGAPEDPV
jgi:hypothetical protein